MGKRESVLATHQSKWWAKMDALALRWSLSEDDRDDLHDLVLSALDEDAALWAAANGGAKGGYARARALTPERRSEISRCAANARWVKSR